MRALLEYADQAAHGAVQQRNGFEQHSAPGSELTGELVQRILTYLYALSVHEQIRALERADVGQLRLGASVVVVAELDPITFPEVAFDG